MIKDGGEEPKSPKRRRRAPALGASAREQQLIAMAMDRAEERFADGTASDGLTIHFLRLATTKMELEKEKIRKEILQLQAKTEAIQSSSRMEELFAEAVNAMKAYGGSINRNDDEIENET